MKKFGLAFLSAAMIVAGIGAANAADATSQNCGTLAAQTKAALNSNQQSANYQSALKERDYGRDFCVNGLQEKGMQHYAQALKLLGVTAS